MTDRPIIFSASMVRALLERRKTQTRRVLKPQPKADRIAWRQDHWLWSNDNGDSGAARVLYAPGDRLWVREACRAVEHEDGTDSVEYLSDAACTRIDNTAAASERWGSLYHYGARGPDRKHREGQKVPSIHMPRWASRLTLTVTDVRVQRVQDISEADARAEGMREGYEGWCLDRHGRFWGPTAKRSLAIYWDHLHGTDSWDANPWVCALTFTVHRCNIDQMEG